jgi:hypothetical protein
MKHSFFILFVLVSLIIVAVSCNDKSYLDIPEPTDMIVVDGWIENGQFAKVLLTRNSPYFTSIDSASMRELVLTRGKVTISDGQDTEILILRKNLKYFPPYIFEGNQILGEAGKTYTLKAEYGGKTVTSTTTIPAPVPLDTFYFKLEPGSDSLGTIFLEFTDPPGERNYYRILTQVKSRDVRYFSTMIMALDDSFFSGKRFGFSVNRGPQSFLSSDTTDYYRKGDTVSIKFCTIDREHYEFWNSFQDEAFNSANPFASSLYRIKTNIEGDGLGIWGGYGVSLYTLIIK